MFLNFDGPFRGNWHGPAVDVLASDALIQEAFGELLPSLLETRVDLFTCDPTSLANLEGIETFARAMSTRIGMPSSADFHLTRLSEPEPAACIAFSLLSQTGSIFGYCLEQQRAICLNAFSCSFYPPYLTAAFSQNWFTACDVTITIGFRGPHAAAFGYLLEIEA